MPKSWSTHPIFGKQSVCQMCGVIHTWCNRATAEFVPGAVWVPWTVWDALATPECVRGVFITILYLILFKSPLFKKIFV